jgi:hypothetical protein
MKYTVQDGLREAKRFEELFSQHGWHIALGGSLIYKGESDNDIDLIAYPHDHRNPAELQIRKLASFFGFSSVELIPEECDYKRNIWSLEHILTGVRINIFVRP